jgi:hypothetical protein
MIEVIIMSAVVIAYLAFLWRCFGPGSTRREATKIFEYLKALDIAAGRDPAERYRKRA